MDDELLLISRRMMSEGNKTVEYFHGLPTQAWKQQVYTTGSCWTVHQVLAHFVSAEIGLSTLVRDVITDGRGAPEGFNIDDFNEKEVAGLRDMTATALIDRFTRARADFSTLVNSLSPADLDRLGRHPWFGETELRKALKLVYRHNMIHLRDIRRALESGRPVPHLEVRPPAQDD